VSDIERVWDRMKVCATECACRGERLTQQRAESLVTHFMRDAHVMPWPPRDVIEFFARELVRMANREAAQTPTIAS
jgi:hypothetical protein